MPDLADVARALTAATVAPTSVIVPLLAGGAVALTGAVVSCVAWLLAAELRSRRTPHLVTRRSSSNR